MRGMQQQLGNLGTISAFACRHRENKKNLCRGGRSQDLGFEPAIPASERPQSYAFQSAPTGIGQERVALTSATDTRKKRKRCKFAVTTSNKFNTGFSISLCTLEIELIDIQRPKYSWSVITSNQSIILLCVCLCVCARINVTGLTDALGKQTVLMITDGNLFLQQRVLAISYLLFFVKTEAGKVCYFTPPERQQNLRAPEDRYMYRSYELICCVWFTRYFTILDQIQKLIISYKRKPMSFSGNTMC